MGVRARRPEDVWMMAAEATKADETCSVVPSDEAICVSNSPPFKKVMAANRAEIAVRIMRAATELNVATAAIYGYEDRYSQHRWGADQSFLLEKTEEKSPVQAYLDITQIIRIAKDAGVDAIHPGYGFLSESPEFAQVGENDSMAGGKSEK